MTVEDYCRGVSPFAGSRAGRGSRDLIRDLGDGRLDMGRVVRAGESSRRSSVTGPIPCRRTELMELRSIGLAASYIMNFRLPASKYIDVIAIGLLFGNAVGIDWVLTVMVSLSSLLVIDYPCDTVLIVFCRERRQVVHRLGDNRKLVVLIHCLADRLEIVVDLLPSCEYIVIRLVGFLFGECSGIRKLRPILETAGIHLFMVNSIEDDRTDIGHDLLSAILHTTEADCRRENSVPFIVGFVRHISLNICNMLRIVLAGECSCCGEIILRPCPVGSIPVMAECGNICFNLCLRRECFVSERCSVRRLARSGAGGGSRYLSRCRYRFGLSMACVVCADAGSGAGPVVAALGPLVCRSSPSVTECRDLHSLRLSRERRVGECCGVDRRAIAFAGGIRGHRTRVDRLCLQMSRIVAADAGRGHGAVVVCPNVGGSAPVVTGSGNLYRLCLSRKRSVGERCGVGANTRILACGRGCYRISRIDRLCLHMSRIVAADSGRSNGAVVGRPNVGGSAPAMAGSGNLHRLCLSRKRSVGESRGVGANTRILACGRGCYRISRIGHLGLCVVLIVLADAGRGHGAVVLCPNVGGSAPAVAGRRNLYDISSGVRLIVEGDRCGIDRLTGSFAGRGSGFGCDLRCRYCLIICAILAGESRSRGGVVARPRPNRGYSIRIEHRDISRISRYCGEAISICCIGYGFAVFAEQLPTSKYISMGGVRIF